MPRQSIGNGVKAFSTGVRGVAHLTKPLPYGGQRDIAVLVRAFCPPIRPCGSTDVFTAYLPKPWASCGYKHSAGALILSGKLMDQVFRARGKREMTLWFFSFLRPEHF